MRKAGDHADRSAQGSSYLDQLLRPIMSNSIAQRQESAAVIQASEATTVLQVIQKAASDPSCDIEKLERLMAMHERMQS
ncbi:single-stranded DNA-binding protein, partial [Pseudomonas aeruginosa]|nr:single-stranded DNA-binding protein [Pseudomonas aeruginosa]EKW9803367.1 single-stranded DNA-binding protein [Pseudomonas aeruginosa]